MEKNESGCNGFYLDKKGRCEVLDWKARKPTIKDCKECICPSNKYKR